MSSSATQRPPRVARVSVPKDLATTVYRRDGCRCHYCGRRVVASVVIELVGRLCPDEFPFPPGHHMPKDRTHPAAERVYPNVDHVQALVSGGAALELANLVTACTPCNEEKGDRLGWERVELERDGWDGLSGACRELLVLAATPLTSTHRAWLRAFETPERF
jgi:5-methylcytosine-specific restriction endonuclease McrA